MDLSPIKPPPLCDPPDSSVTPPDFRLPENACDCHYHIFDGPSPQVLPRTYTAPVAPLSELNRLHNTLGFTRSVAVQPSIYGTDNRTTLSAITSTNSTKAIVVVDDSVSLANLVQLKDAGAVGCRVNLLFQSNAQMEDFKILARKAADIDWHLQLLVDVSTIDELEKIVNACDVPVVFDHMGHMPARNGVNDAGFQQLLRLLGAGKAWVKLSGAYRLSSNGRHHYHDVDPLVAALLSTNPDQLVWGSDWPHPHVPAEAMPNDTNLLNLLAKWVPDSKLRDKILAANPEQLYGF